MIINQGNLQRLYTGFKTLFNQGRSQADSQYSRVVTTVTSQTREETYGWLGKIPNFREWVGDRVVQNIMAHDYAIKNVPYENTIAVDRDDIDDDQYGVYGPLFQEMGLATEAHPNQLVFGLLKEGWAKTAYDGQYFFDTDHPVLDETGEPVSVANTDGGGGAPWFLMDASRAIKPIIWQTRRPYDLVRMDTPTDEAVFMRKEFRYGVDARVAAGFGLWQVCWGSRQPLTGENYRKAREALLSMKGDYGRPLGLMPRLLVVPPALEFDALEIVNAERNAAGATNVYRGTAEVLVVPWLA